MDLSNKKEYEKVSVFVLTRKMIRDKLRKQYGNKGLLAAWRNYQKENLGKPKLIFHYGKPAVKVKA